jgi:hypothetical protein
MAGRTKEQRAAMSKRQAKVMENLHGKYPCKYKCGAVFVLPTGRGNHESWCEKNPNRKLRKSEQEPVVAQGTPEERERRLDRDRHRAKRQNNDSVELVPAKRSRPVGSTNNGSKIDRVLQLSALDQATTMVLVAKWPRGIDKSEYHRVVTLVKAVEHG